MFDLSTLAGRFSALVEGAGLTLAALDALAGKNHPGHAAAIAAGRRTSPRPESLAPYAKVLGTDVSYLLLGRGEPPRQVALRAAVQAAKQLRPLHRRR